MVRQIVLFFVLTVILTVMIDDTRFMAGMALVWVVIATGIVMINRQTFLEAPRSQVA